MKGKIIRVYESAKHFLVKESFSIFHHSKSLKLINIAFEIGKYLSWPYTLPLSGWANIIPSLSDPSFCSRPTACIYNLIRGLYTFSPILYNNHRYVFIQWKLHFFSPAFQAAIRKIGVPSRMTKVDPYEWPRCRHFASNDFRFTMTIAIYSLLLVKGCTGSFQILFIFFHGITCLVMRNSDSSMHHCNPV